MISSPLTVHIARLVVINAYLCDKIPEGQLLPVFLKSLDLCAAATNAPTLHNGVVHADDVGDNSGGKSTCISAAGLTDINVDVSDTTPILNALTNLHPTLLTTLRRLVITRKNCDESAGLGAFAAQATQLEVLGFRYDGLTSVQGLEGRCEHLKIVDLSSCMYLRSLAGLEHHTRLEVVDILGTPIASLEPLLTCPSLVKLVCGGGELRSLDGLQNHECLEEVSIAAAPISSVDALLTCPALKKVSIEACSELTSLEGLAYHSRLREVIVSEGSSITSIVPLSSCLALTKVVLYDCGQLSSLKGLEGHPWLVELDVSATAIDSAAPLRTCPALVFANFGGCSLLSSLRGLENHAQLVEIDASATAITSIEPLRTCPALKKVNLTFCQELTSLKGLGSHHTCLEEVDASYTAITAVVPLATCPSLKKVNLVGCAGLTAASIHLPPSVHITQT